MPTFEELLNEAQKQQINNIIEKSEKTENTNE